MACLRQFASEIILVIVSIVFEFQTQGIPRRLIFNAAKDGGWATKDIAKADIARIVRLCAMTIFIAHPAKRVGNIARITGVAPCHPEGEIKWPRLLAGHQILTVKPTRTSNITFTKRHLR